MKLVKLIGVLHNEGAFPNEKTGDMIPFDNIILHCTTEEVPKTLNNNGSKKHIAGIISQVVQFKTADIDDIFGFKVGYDYLELLIGEEIVIDGKEYGQKFVATKIFTGEQATSLIRILRPQIIKEVEYVA